MNKNSLFKPFRLKSVNKLWIFFVFGIPLFALGQAPALPPTNLGLTNMSDGFGGKPGFYWVSYLQIYETGHFKDQYGKRDPQNDLKINSVSSIHLMAYQSNLNVLAGKLGFLVGIPIVKLSSTSLSQIAPSANPGVLGDLVQGTWVQWSDRKLFKRPFTHRVELDIFLPTGSYHGRYAINTSAHLYTFSLYHSFSYSISDRFGVSARNTFNYNTRILGSPEQPGAFYNGNYALEYVVLKRLKIEAAGYYLAQFNQDGYAGNKYYYEETYGIKNTRERVIGFGPGFSYVTAGGIFIEGKVFFEGWARNASEGVRPTLRLGIPVIN